MRNKSKIVLLVLFMIVGVLGVAAQVSFNVQAPRQVEEGRKFAISYVLRNAEGSGFREPEIGGAQKLYGPALSTSYSSQWVNGVSSNSSSQEYTMMYKAVKAGTYKVGPATITVNGKKLSTKPFTIEVLPSGNNANSNMQNRGGVTMGDIQSQSADKPVSSHDLFVRIEMSKPRVYEQEAVVCTIKLYTKYNIRQFIATQQPSFNGFLIEELPIPSISANVETVNGQNYLVAVLKKCILFPQQSGKLTITSGNYDVTAEQYDVVNSIFGRGGYAVEKKLKVTSNTATVNILPLPNPKPATFTGAVGKFNMATSLHPSNFKTFEAATYSCVISGSGNIKYLKAPSINFPSQFDVYDPQSTINAKPNGGTVFGSIKFDYSFIPEYVGNYEIPELVFTYFNPESGKYETIKAPKHKVNVAKGSGSAASARKSLDMKNKDILHIKMGDMNLAKEHNLYLSSILYWMFFYILPILVVVFLLFYYRKALKERSNMQLMKTKRASKVAKKRLKEASAFMAQNDKTKFYASTLNSMWGYLSDKLGIPVSELNKEKVENELKNYGVDSTVISSLMSLLDKCEYAQYAPDMNDNNMSEIYNQASDLMDKLENTKRK